MTEFNLLSTVVGGMMLALVVAGSLIFLPTILETETELKTSALSIEVINAAHLARSCLGEDGIPETLLDSSSGNTICKECSKELGGLCRNNIDLGVKIRDPEDQQEWDFDYTGEDEHATEIFVNILKETGEITIGRLYAEA